MGGHPLYGHECDGQQVREAGRHFREFVTKYPGSELIPKALYWSGDAYQKAEFPADSYQAFTDVLVQFPDTKWAKFALNRLTAPVSHALWLKVLIPHYPDLVTEEERAFVSCVIALREEGGDKKPEVAQQFERFCGDFPHSRLKPVAAYHAGKVYWDVDNKEKAVALLEQVPGLAPGTCWAVAANRLTATRARSRSRKSLIESALKTEPKLGVSPSGEVAPYVAGSTGDHLATYFDALYAGMVALQSDRLDQAIARLVEAGTQDTGEKRFQELRSEADSFLSHLREGKTDASQARELLSKHEVLRFYLLARAVEMLGDDSDAGRAATLRFIQSIDFREPMWALPERLAYHLMEKRLALACTTPRDSAEEEDAELSAQCLSDLRTLSRHAPVDTARPPSLAKLANLYYKAKDYPKASELYRQVQRDYPFWEHQDLCALNAGKCLTMMKDYEGAAKEFGRLITDMPGSSYATKAIKYRRYVLRSVRKGDRSASAP